MIESIEDKLKRIRKYGMNEVEVFDPGEESRILLAQIQFLENNLSRAKEALEIIVSTHPNLKECYEIAEEALVMTSVRSRNHYSNAKSISKTSNQE